MQGRPPASNAKMRQLPVLETHLGHELCEFPTVTRLARSLVALSTQGGCLGFQVSGTSGPRSSPKAVGASCAPQLLSCSDLGCPAFVLHAMASQPLLQQPDVDLEAGAGEGPVIPEWVGYRVR